MLIDGQAGLGYSGFSDQLRRAWLHLLIIVGGNALPRATFPSKVKPSWRIGQRAFMHEYHLAPADFKTGGWPARKMLGFVRINVDDN